MTPKKKNSLQSEVVEIEKKFNKSEEAAHSNQPDGTANRNPEAHNFDHLEGQVVFDAEQASQCRNS